MAKMAPRLQPPDASALLKRTRSADSSNRATPAIEKTPEPDDALLPAFLRQTEAEIENRFEQLDSNQRDRLEDPRVRPAESPWTQVAGNDTRFRNRYLDIRPWDQTRVKLKVPEGCSDYINASHILLRCSQTGQSRCYIATQGPKESSMEHFWQMVWHETTHFAVVIMLTQLAEGFREKCYKYFPENADSDPMDLRFTNENGEELTAKLRVMEASWHDQSMTMVRTLQLSCNDESKVVHHLFFQGWPDYGVPEAEDRSALLELIRLSRDKNLGWDNPRIVHCSAGVGRTGSFIAIEHLLAELSAGSMDDLVNTEDPIFDTIDALRRQRMTMVQSVVQYQFLYELVAEAAHARIKERAIAEKMQGLSSGVLSSGSGEPAYKARRFTRAMKEVFSNIRSRSSSRKPTKRGTASPESGPSRPVSRSDAAPGRPSSSSEVKDVGESKGFDSECQSPEVYHDAAEDWSTRVSSEKVGSQDSRGNSPQQAIQTPAILDTMIESQLPDAPVEEEPSS